GEEVLVTLGADQLSSKADREGNWQVRMPARKASAQPVPLTVSGKNRISLSNVVVGEVWLCTGPSDMQTTLDEAANAKEEIAAGDHPLIRQVIIPRTPSETPKRDVAPRPWRPASPQTVDNFSAVAYHFARNLQQSLDVPIGLIGSNLGGTRIEPWTAPEGF